MVHCRISPRSDCSLAKVSGDCRNASWNSKADQLVAKRSMIPPKCSKCPEKHAQIISESGRLSGEGLTLALHTKVSKTIKVYDALVHGDQVVVAISGGPCSMALAHLLLHFCVLDFARPHRGKVRLCLFKFHFRTNRTGIKHQGHSFAACRCLVESMSFTLMSLQWQRMPAEQKPDGMISKHSSADPRTCLHTMSFPCKRRVRVRRRKRSSACAIF